MTPAALRRYDVDANGCWVWSGARSRGGYGRISRNYRWVNAHRAFYEHFVGPIPEGLHIDHLCRNRACVNPKHLEPVTPRENTRRSPIARGAVNARKTHCIRGHEFTPENTIVVKRGRNCRTCTYASNRASRQRAQHRAVGIAQPVP